MNHKKTITILAALLINTIAFADDTIPAPNKTPEQTVPESLSNGFYVEPYLGYGYVNAQSHATRRNGLAGGIALGYKAMDNWAFDTGYTQLPSANVSTYYFYLSLKYISTIKHNWDVFAKLGPAYARGSRVRGFRASSEFTLYADLGATYWIRSNLGFVIQTALTTCHNNVPLTFNLTGGLDYFF